MKVTKYEHAFLCIEDQGKKLIIDPGSYSPSLPTLEDVCAIIITHVHADHFDLTHIDDILSKNPDAKIYTVSEVAKELGDRPHEVVSANTSELCGVFHVSFFVDRHAVIHESLPVWENTGVTVNETLYYPGDSFALPHMPVKILAAPAGSPWAKIGEEIDFITAIKPEQVFPTHNAHLSEIGLQGRDSWLKQAAEKVGAKYTVLKPGDSLSV